MQLNSYIVSQSGPRNLLCYPWPLGDGMPGMRGACRARGLSAKLASSKANIRGSRQSANIYKGSYRAGPEIGLCHPLPLGDGLPGVRGAFKSPGPLSEVNELQGKQSRLETKREGLRPREFLKWDPAPRRPFDSLNNRVSLASSAGKEIIPRQINYALLASLTSYHIIHPSVFAGRNTMPVAS